MPTPNDEAATEQMIQDKGLTAPRLTPEDIDAIIVRANYHVFPGTTVTVCLMELKNGFATVGYSAAVSPENFNEEIGRSVAYDKAREQIWQLEGYRLREALYQQGKK